jgi:hypothetical protein
LPYMYVSSLVSLFSFGVVSGWSSFITLTQISLRKPPSFLSLWVSTTIDVLCVLSLEVISRWKSFFTIVEILLSHSPLCLKHSRSLEQKSFTLTWVVLCIWNLSPSQSASFDTMLKNFTIPNT